MVKTRVRPFPRDQNSVADLESISHGQKFVTKNGTDYGVPQAGSTVIVTSPNSGKTTYVMDAEGIWVVTEDISYSAVVANPSDAATAKLEKLKVNDTTYANWTENEIKSIASESGGGKLYRHDMYFFYEPSEGYRITVYTSNETPYTPETFFAKTDIIYCCGIAETGGKTYPIGTIVTSEYGNNVISYINSDGSTTDKIIDVSRLRGNDTVHEM